MTISPFGWQDHGPPDINAANLEAMHAAAGAYADEQAVDPNDIGYDVVLCIGQSNMAGEGSAYSVPDLDPIDPRVSVYGSPASAGIAGAYKHPGAVVTAVEPLHNYMADGGTAGGMSMALPFARLYARTRPVNRNVLLIAAAYSSTGFETNVTGDALNWKAAAANNLYANAVAMTNAALALDPKNRVVGAIWHQGERDATNQTPQATYEADLDELIAALRAEFGEDLWFVLGQMTKEGLASNSYEPPINAAHVDTPRRNVLTGFAYGPPLGYSDPTNGPLHFSAAGQRLNGASYFKAMQRALLNVTGTAPVAPASAMLVADSDTQATVTWNQPDCRYTAFKVEYTTDAGATWTTLATAGVDVTATITGLPEEATVQARVSTINEQGTSATVESNAVTLNAPAPTPTPTGDTLDADMGIAPTRAYSLRKIVAAYAGPAVNVRRSSDNTTQDIGFDADGNLDTTALLAFVGSGDGFVSTWYDQSGNGHNVTQATAAAQPQIVAAGAVESKSGVPTVAFNGTQVLSATDPGMYAAGSASSIGVISAAAATTGDTFLGESNTASGARYWPFWQKAAGGGLGRAINNGSSNVVAEAATQTIGDAALHQVAFTDTGSALEQWIDEAATSLGTTSYTRSTTALNTFCVGASISNAGVNTGVVGWISEMVVFSATVLTSTELTAGAANQKAYYSTP